MSDRNSAPKWVGNYVIWWAADEWEFHRCVRCDGHLKSARARKNGYGPGCANASGIASLVRVTLRAEREKARSDLAQARQLAATGTPMCVRPWNRSTRKALTGKARRTTT